MPLSSARGGRPRRLAAAVAVLVVPVLAGCTASFGAQTQVSYDPGQGTNAATGDNDALKLRSLVAVAEEEGHATLVGTIVNSGDDERITNIGVAEGSAETDPQQIELAEDSVTRIGTDDPEAVTVILNGPRLVPGHTVPLSITFGEAEPVDVEAQVVPNEGAFADVDIPDSQEAPAHTPEEESAEDDEGGDGEAVS